MESLRASDVEDYQTFSVEVLTDCGQFFRSHQTFYVSHFQDVFGFIMKDAERRIRDMVAGKIFS